MKIVYCVYSLESPGAMFNTYQLELPMSRTYFHCSKGVRAIEVGLYYTLYAIANMAATIITVVTMSLGALVHLHNLPFSKEKPFLRHPVKFH